MRIPEVTLGIQIKAAVELANIFYLDQWGSLEEKRLFLSERTDDTPITIGPKIKLPLDVANIQEYAGNGFLTSKMAFSILTLIVVYKGFVLPIVTNGTSFTKKTKRNIGIQDNTKRSRKKRSSLTSKIQEYINPWVIAGLEHQPKLANILSKMGVPERNCQERLVCQAYTHLPNLPHGIRDLLVVLSKRMVDLHEFELAMVYGLGGGGCDFLHLDQLQQPTNICEDPTELVNNFLSTNTI